MKIRQDGNLCLPILLVSFLYLLAGFAAATGQEMAPIDPLNPINPGSPDPLEVDYDLAAGENAPPPPNSTTYKILDKEYTFARDLAAYGRMYRVRYLFLGRPIGEYADVLATERNKITAFSNDINLSRFWCWAYNFKSYIHYKEWIFSIDILDETLLRLTGTGNVHFNKINFRTNKSVPFTLIDIDTKIKIPDKIPIIGGKEIPVKYDLSIPVNLETSVTGHWKIDLPTNGVDVVGSLKSNTKAALTRDVIIKK